MDESIQQFYCFNVKRPCIHSACRVKRVHGPCSLGSGIEVHNLSPLKRGVSFQNKGMTSQIFGDCLKMKLHFMAQSTV